MVHLSKKNLSFASFFALLLCLHGGCAKEQIAPSNQSLAFVKYYGHVGEQKGSDLKRTLDGGYIMIGSTNSYSSEAESDILIVKTDSLGNELWSTALGRASGSYIGIDSALIGKYIRYKEEGIKIEELPDASGYVLVGNRTYVSYISGTSTTPFNPEYKTKVVVYQLDAAGVATSINGVELRPNTKFTEKVSDMKIDTVNGPISYILTGYTTDVVISKPRSGAADKTDVYTVLLDQAFNELWTPGLETYGFDGEDYGVSIQILPNAYYLVTGTIQVLVPSNNTFQDHLFGVRMVRAGGPLNYYDVGDETYDMVGGCSVYDAENHKITIAGTIVDGANLYKGHAAMFQVDEELDPISGGDAFGLYYYRPTAPTTFPPTIATHNKYYPKSIALLPDNTGFMVSMTHEKSTTEHNVAIMKLDENMLLQEGWPYYFGYEDAVGSPNPTENAGTVITVTEGIAGTSQSTVKGYAFTGTFDIGTNDMMGLIKIRDNGTLNP